MFRSPDPSLTANLYCAGGLDPVVFRVIAPFRRELPQDAYLWLVRYGKGGEHLKLRLHTPDADPDLLRRRLAERAGAFFAALPEPPPRTPGKVDAPPLDPEDEVDHPDRTLLWTTYRRSHISLGGQPFLDDDLYAAHMTRCLGSACELVLSLEPGDSGVLPHRTRQVALLQGLIAGLAALGFSTERRADYLAYHRDWLLRFLRGAQSVQGFEERIAKLGAAVHPIRTLAEAEWNGGDPLENPWRTSLSDLLDYISPFANDPDYRLDPFAPDPVFAPLFKAFHGLGNQLGLPVADEAFAHHLLLRATTG